MASAIRLVKAACLAMCNFAMPRAMNGVEDEKKKRLAQALRDNLRRRKAQAREGDVKAGQAESEKSPKE